MTRQRSLSQRFSSSVEEQLKRVGPRPKNSRVASESFIGWNQSGVFKGQVVGSPNKNEQDDSDLYLNHDDINRKAIQIFHTEGAKRDSSGIPILQRLLSIINPYDPFRRTFDLATVVAVLLLVFFIPFEIGFVWYETPSAQKIFFVFLDFWFAMDIILNFRTGYVNHGTVVMDPKKIASNYLSSWFLVDLLGTVPFEQIISSNVSSRKSLKLESPRLYCFSM